MSESEFERLERCRRDLYAGRAEARAAARKLEQEMMQPIQDATDLAVVRALAAGATKSAVAAALGESRVTLNERLDRAAGTHVKDEAVEAYTQANPAYVIRDGKLDVMWDNYGPEHLTAIGSVEIIRDEDTGSYWFMSDGENYNEVATKLDTQFSGWYYEDAAKFIAENMEEQ